MSVGATGSSPQYVSPTDYYDKEMDAALQSTGDAINAYKTSTSKAQKELDESTDVNQGG